MPQAIEPEPVKPQPKEDYEQVILAIGVILMALVAIHHLLLESLGWCLRNRRLLLWVCRVSYEISREFLTMFAWAPLVGWVTFIGAVAQLFGVDLGRRMS